MFTKTIKIAIALVALFVIMGAKCQPLPDGTGYVPDGGGCLPGGNECVYKSI